MKKFLSALPTALRALAGAAFITLLGLTALPGTASAKTAPKPASTCNNSTLTGSSNWAVPSGTGTGRRVVVKQNPPHVWLVNANGSVAADQPAVGNPMVLVPGNYKVLGTPHTVREPKSGWGPIVLHGYIGFAHGGDVAFHQVPFYDSGPCKGHPIHADSLLGTNLAFSGGCISLSAWMIDKTDRFATPGTPVFVIR
jgi:hypothetical protein